MNTLRLSKLSQSLALAALLGGVSAAVLAPKAHASDSVDVTVNATIIGVCKFFTSSPVLNITNTGSGSQIDPSVAGPATGSVNILYRCSNGTSPTFTVPATTTVTCTGGACGASSTMTTANSSTASPPAGTGMGSGNDKTLAVTAQITQANYQNAPVGAYQGTATVSVTP